MDLTCLVKEEGIGVTIFFVLSGFLLAMPFLDDIERSISIEYWKKFYLKRLKRILPMYYITIIVFLIFWPDFIIFSGGQSIIKHFCFFQANGHLWSTQQEICFYLICPIIFLMIWLLLSKFKLTNTLTGILLIAISFLLKKYLTKDIFYLNGNGKQQDFRIYIFLFGIALTYLINGELYNRIKKNIIYVKINSTLSIIAL